MAVLGPHSGSFMNVSFARLAARVTLAFGPLVLCAACATSHYYDVRYMPAPVEVEVGTEGVPGSQVRALVSVLGVARPANGGQTPAQVEMRMRLENLGSVEARLVPASLSLVSANLIAFQPAVVMTPGDVTIAPAATQTIDIVFAAPLDKRLEELDWNGLNLRFTLEFKGTGVTTGATFGRVVYGPAYYDPAFHFGVAYGTCW
jgi:hypothetical protein